MRENISPYKNQIYFLLTGLIQMYTSDTIMDIKYSGINYKNKIMCTLFFHERK